MSVPVGRGEEVSLGCFEYIPVGDGNGAGVQIQEPGNCADSWLSATAHGLVVVGRKVSDNSGDEGSDAWTINTMCVVDCRAVVWRTLKAGVWYELADGVRENSGYYPLDPHSLTMPIFGQLNLAFQTFSLG